MGLTLWCIRTNTNDEFDPTKVYGTSPNLFSLKIHHGGMFTKSPGRCYVNENITFIDMIDSNDFSIPELNMMMQELGYVQNTPMWYHFRTPDSDLDFGLRELRNNEDIIYLLKYVTKNRLLEVYIEQSISYLKKVLENLPIKRGLFIEKGVCDNPFDDDFFSAGNIPTMFKKDFGHGSGSNVFGKGSGTNVNQVEVVQTENEDNRDSSDSGEDSDFLVDEENVIDDVEVDIRNFRNIVDDDVEWIGCKENPEKVIEGNLEAETLNLDDFDSGSDSEDDPIRKKTLKTLIREHNTNLNKKAHFYVGQTFGTKSEIKELINLHSVETRRHLHITKDDKKRIRVICRGHIPIFSVSNMPTDPSVYVVSGFATVNGPTAVNEPETVSGFATLNRPKTVNEFETVNVPATIKKPRKKIKAGEKKAGGDNTISCPWVLHISKGVDQESWMVKTLKDNHKCLQSRDLKKCTAKFLSKDIEEQVIPNKKLEADIIRDQLQKKYEVGVSKHKIYRANKRAKVKVMGDYTHQYSLLRDYLLELQTRNPETTIKLDFEIEPNPESETRQFKRVYVCLGALKRGFKATGRDLLGLDGCFMKGVYPGQCLTAVGVDPNNQIYPVAYAIVEAENKSSWTWFLDCLGDDLELNHMSNFTFMSDRQKGIIQAIAELFPVAEHRYCLKHIYDNMKGSWRGQLYKDFIWKLATITTTQQFNKTMEDFKKVNKDAYEWLKKIPARHWSRSHFTGRAHCDVLLNNMCEVFNRQLVDGREKPIILALEYIREYLMKRIVIVQKTISKCDGPLTPNATLIFNSIKTEAAKYKATWNGDDLFQVVGPWMDQHIVNMFKKSCTCRKWELTRMPCKHVVATVWDMAENHMEVGIPESYVHPVYWLQTWKAMYQFKIGPTTGRTNWPKSDCPILICAPKHHVQIGRPRKKRRKSMVELEMVKQGKMSRQAVSVKCTNCKEKGHNKRTCTNVASKGAPGNGKHKKSKVA